MPIMKRLTVDGVNYDTVGEASVTQVLSSGTKIATVTIDGAATDLYAPSGGGGGSDMLTFYVSSLSTNNTPYVDSALTTTAFEHYGYDLSAAWADVSAASSIRLIDGYGTSKMRISFVTDAIYDRSEDAIDLGYMILGHTYSAAIM